jgi:uncharacterized BrkB/YihY/UPF0761 family membrane protein
LEFIAPALGRLLGQNIDEIIRARGSVTIVALVGLVWELAKKAFLFFISTYLSVSNLVYGSVAAIIAFLAWAYLSGLIFLFGAYLSVSYCQQRQQQQASADTHSSISQ